MERTKEISEELSALSKTVAGISRLTPYQAPDGYFEGFPGRVIGLTRLIAKEADADPSEAGVDPSLAVLDQAGRVNPYTVPAGYFADFAQKMLDRIHAEQAGQDTQAGPLSAGEELSLISPLLSRIDKRMPFTAPERYFAELAAAVVSGMQAIEFVNDELENLSPLMVSLRNRPTYQVPEGYFDGVAGRVLERLKQPVPAKVVPMHRKRNWLKYSAAAALAGLLLTGGWMVFHKSAVPVSTIASFDPTRSLSGVSDQELESYLDNHNVPLADLTTNSTATLDFTDNDIKGMLGDVSDTELKQYEEDQESAKDPATN